MFVADEANNPDNVKSAWKEYPGEKPKKNELIQWVESWEDDINTAGLSTLMRGEMPFEVAKLTERPTITVPRDA